MPLTSGTRLGSYEILSPLGAGGMGEVYKARDSKLDREVAIKVLPDAFTHDAERLARFQREAKLLASLNHPNIGSIYGLEESGGTRFLILELVPGKTLEEVIHECESIRKYENIDPAARVVREPSHPLEVEEAFKICRQIAEALEAAHEKGIIHRDLKPANIKITPEGKVKVLDFGLAKAFAAVELSPNLSASPTLTLDSMRSGVILGTAAYMSPEQARGKPLDKRTDIWSFGCVLYECLTGKQAFAGETVSDRIAAILGREPDWRVLSSSTPLKIKDLLRRCLRKDRDRRLHDIADARIEIEEVMDNPSELSSVLAAPGGLPEFRRSSRMLPWVTLALAVVAAAAVAVAIWSLSHSTQTGGTESAKRFKASQVTTSFGLDIYPTLSPDGSSIAYCSDRNGNFEIYVKQLAVGGRDIQLTSDGEQNFQPSWSADGQRIAYHKMKRGGIWVVPALGGTSRQLTDFGSRPAWSRDGSWIAFQSEPLVDLSVTSFSAMPPSTLWIIPLQGGHPIQVTKVGVPPGGHGAPSWSPDGKRIVFVANDTNLSEIWSVSAKGDDMKRIIQGQRLHDPIYSPDGASIYYTGISGISWGLWKAQLKPGSGELSGVPVEIKDTGATLFKHLMISADGGKLACSALSMANNLWSVPVSPRSSEATAAPKPLTRDTSYRKSWPIFSPDGKNIVFYVIHIGASRDLWMMDTDGNNPMQLTTGQPGSDVLGWLAHDQIAYVSNRGGTWKVWSADINSGREKPLFDAQQSQFIDTNRPFIAVDVSRLSPDGRKIVFNSRSSGTVNVWTVPIEGGQPRQLTFDKELAGFASWSPDGKYLAFEMKRGDDTHIAMMPSNGGTITQLTFDHGQSWPFSWSPDGDKIAFAGLRKGLWNIWWVSRSTKRQKQITNYSKLNAYVRYPAWSPLGNQIVYEQGETTGNIWTIDLK